MKSASKYGFTLLEVMIAIAILSVALVAIAGINSGAISMHSFSKRLSIATLLARSKMADIESKLQSDDLPADDQSDQGNFDDEGFPDFRWSAEIIRPKTENISATDLLTMLTGMSGKPGDSKGGDNPLSALMAGLLPKESSDPSTKSAANSGITGPQSMTAAAAAGGGGLMGTMMQTQVQSMLDLLGKSLREVKLTVSWPNGNQTDQFTVTTHVVSFGRGTNQAISDPTLQGAQSTPNSNSPTTNPSGNTTTTQPRSSGVAR